MLDLDSARWEELRHAYGTAGDIPGLLRELRSTPTPERHDEGPWFRLWSALCHQGDVYTATYAAVPHMIAMARERVPGERKEYLLFVGHAECCRHGDQAPRIPADLRDAYNQAVTDARALFPGELDHCEDETEARYMLAGMAALAGFPSLARALELLEDGD